MEGALLERFLGRHDLRSTLDCGCEPAVEIEGHRLEVDPIVTQHDGRPDADAEAVGEGVLRQLEVALGRRQPCLVVRLDDPRAADVAVRHDTRTAQAARRVEQSGVLRGGLPGHVGNPLGEQDVVVRSLRSRGGGENLRPEPRLLHTEVVLGVADRPRGHVDAAPAEEGLHDAHAVVGVDVADVTADRLSSPHVTRDQQRRAGRYGLADEGGWLPRPFIRDALPVDELVVLLEPDILLTRAAPRQRTPGHRMKEGLRTGHLGPPPVARELGDLDVRVLLERELDALLESEHELPGLRRVPALRPHRAKRTHDALGLLVGHGGRGAGRTLGRRRHLVTHRLGGGRGSTAVTRPEALDRPDRQQPHENPDQQRT